jgi:hypothetical protein
MQTAHEKTGLAKECRNHLYTNKKCGENTNRGLRNYQKYQNDLHIVTQTPILLEESNIHKNSLLRSKRVLYNIASISAG